MCVEVQEEQEAKAEEELFPDAAVQERKRAQEAERWRLQQLKAGTAPEDNANFQVSLYALHSPKSCYALQSLASSHCSHLVCLCSHYAHQQHSPMFCCFA